ncbi:MAG TPA: hypothetical protein ENJ60_05935 [Aeromonadales bacterium]|nr:hypothetical protein [Aeromonadales bacterium]
MKLTLLHHTSEGMNRYLLNGWRLHLLLLISLIILPGIASYMTYRWVISESVDYGYTEQALASMRQQIKSAEGALKDARQDSQMQLDEITRRVGIVQSEVLRINAVGKRLLEVAGIDASEFDFDSIPSVGGPEKNALMQQQDKVALDRILDKVEQNLQNKRQQISILESVLLNREMDIASYISGRPVKKGWNSSQFGKRIDPFTGNAAWHEGMDFAGKLGDPVVATAAGVVSFVGKKWGYGLTVEINHGNGIKTRYGHNLEVLVKPGQVIAKEQVISKMGSSGRSTGPHVHYEVLKNGKPVDPKKYVWRRGKKS